MAVPFHRGIVPGWTGKLVEDAGGRNTDVRAGNQKAHDACDDWTAEWRRNTPYETFLKLFDATRIPVLGRALDAYALRHKVIAQNLANITTPGYKAKSVSFEDQLAGAIQGGTLHGTRTNAQHMPIGADPVGGTQPRVEESRPLGDALASGINNVDLDGEMAELAKNQIRFKFATRLIGDTFRGLQKSIRGTQ